MTKLFISVEDSSFKERVKIRFSNINQGLEKYKMKFLMGSEEGLKDFLIEAMELNGRENSFVDFYYGNLDAESRKRFLSLLKEDEQDFKEALSGIDHGQIYFQLRENIAPVLLRLSLDEILFSTFYFTAPGFTIWGNYGRKFPCFYKEEEELEYYKNIIMKNNLDCYFT